MSLAEKLISLRKQKGLTQTDLAERLDVSRQAISRWEVGASVPSTDNLKVLGELYKVSVDYLLNDNAEDSSDHVDMAQIPPNEQGENKNGKKFIGIAICAAVALLVTVMILVGLGKKPEQSQESVLPMENMTVIEIEEKNYPIVTFSIE